MSESDEAQPRIRSRIPSRQQKEADAPESDNSSEDNGSEVAEEKSTGGGIQARQSSQQSSRSGGDTGWMKRGTEAQKVHEREKAKNEEKERRRAEGIFVPYRFWLPAGKQVELVLLDDEPGPCFYEHHLQDPNTGKWDIYEGCPKEFEACPLCDGVAGGKESYYVMMLSAVVLDPYINKNGQTVPHSRKLLAVKTNDQGFFMRTYEREGSLRGVHLLMARASKQDSNIGRPEFIQKHGEADIMASFGHPAITTNDGRTLKKANADCFPFEYSKIWTRPSGDDLRARYGGAAPMGSDADLSGGKTISSGGSANYDDLEDSIPF